MTVEQRFRRLDRIVEILHYEMRAEHGEVDPIKGHPGDGRSILVEGMPRLLSHLSIAGDTIKGVEARTGAETAYDRAEKWCDSPIERNLLAALLTGCWECSRTALPAVHNARDYDEPFPDADVVIVPQLAILRYRLDFGVIVRKRGVGRIIGFECDGAEFHQDSERDRARDRYLALALDIPVVRLTGKQLYQEPLRLTNQVIAAISEWAAE